MPKRAGILSILIISIAFALTSCATAQMHTEAQLNAIAMSCARCSVITSFARD